MFVVAYPRETQEMVLDAHIKALNNSEVFSSDNLKTAVDSIFVGKERQAGYDSTSWIINTYLHTHANVVVLGKNFRPVRLETKA